LIHERSTWFGVPRPQNKITGVLGGFCQVPGWGLPASSGSCPYEIGLASSDLAPEDFLHGEPEAVADVLSRHRLQAIGGFTAAATPP
jgi:hypothetical protein